MSVMAILHQLCRRRAMNNQEIIAITAMMGTALLQTLEKRE
jgi:hypothetical protein